MEYLRPWLRLRRYLEEHGELPQTATEELVDPATGEVVAQAGAPLDEELKERILWHLKVLT